MRVIVNGETRTVPDGSTVAELIVHLIITQRPIAVELNREIVAREHYSSRMLAEGDDVQIVRFVGGG